MGWGGGSARFVAGSDDGVGDVEAFKCSSWGRVTAMVMVPAVPQPHGSRGSWQ